MGNQNNTVRAQNSAQTKKLDNAVRVRDLTTGHGCYPPQEIVEGSPNVFVNNRHVVRNGDHVDYHTCNPADIESLHNGWCEIKDDHGRKKFKVVINGRKPARLLDRIEPHEETEPPPEKPCGGKVMTASSNVFFGE